MWVLKIKGQTYNVKHVVFRNVSFRTKETPDNPHTKGSLLIKGKIQFDKLRENAIIYGSDGEDAIP